MKLTSRSRKSLSGFLFILPWLIGFLLFFVVPFGKNIFYSLNHIKFSQEGLKFTWVGFNNFRFAFFEDPNMVQTLTEVIIQLFYEVPVILVLSIFMAILLKSSFFGRRMARAIFFLPVIVGTGIVIQIFRTDPNAAELQQVISETSYIFQSTGIEDLLYGSGVSEEIVSYFTTAINEVFSLTWKSGIQILIFLAGLNSIPGVLYEVARVEGATSWETFWKITFPLLSPIILLNIVYSIIDSFMSFDNMMIRMIRKISVDDLNYGYGAAVSIIYFITVFVIIMFVIRVISKRVYYMS